MPRPIEHATFREEPYARQWMERYDALIDAAFQKPGPDVRNAKEIIHTLLQGPTQQTLQHLYLPERQTTHDFQLTIGDPHRIIQHSTALYRIDTHSYPAMAMDIQTFPNLNPLDHTSPSQPRPWMKWMLRLEMAPISSYFEKRPASLLKILTQLYINGETSTVLFSKGGKEKHPLKYMDAEGQLYLAKMLKGYDAAIQKATPTRR